MSRVSGRLSSLGAASGRMITAPYAPAVAGALLGAAAAAEALTRATAAGGTYGGELELALVLVSLLTTAPAGLLWGQPLAAALAVTGASVTSLALFHALTVAGLAAQLIVLYRLARSGSARLATCLAVPFLILALVDLGRSQAEFRTVLLASLAPAAIWAATARRADSEAAEHSAATQVIAGTLVEHTARGERARISRELHDVVAHHISMIAVQAENARLTTAGLPAAGAQRLSAIGDTARSALTEMRRLLGVLREDVGAMPADRRPQPGLHQLNQLLDEAREISAAGVRLIVRGQIATLDPGVELAGYRIVQEALTNSRRHAAGSAVDVELHYADGALRLRIRDNGPGPPPEPPADGHGLLGMRERAAAAGGELRTGAAAGGGFLVEATLPTDGTRTLASIAEQAGLSVAAT